MRRTSANGRRAHLLARVAPLAGLFGLPALILLAAQAIITTIRLLQSAGGPPGARNLEATYHVLLTATALREVPLRATLGLPVVTLGGKNNEGYAWAAAVGTPSRVWIYTSFPPGSFWIAALVTALPIAGILALLLLNGALGAATAMLIAAVVDRTVASTTQASSTRFAGSIAGLAYLLSEEALQSHGPVFWAHSVLQPILAAQVLLIVVMLEGGPTRRRLVLLSALTVAGGYVEWTEYAFALLAATTVLVIPSLRRRIGTAAVVLAVTAVVTAAILFLHFVRRLGVGPAVGAWTRSADARADAPFLSLVDGVVLSVGGTLLALGVVSVAGLALGVRGPAPRRWLFVVLLFTLPCVENLLLRQHATEFTFDRLKDVVPIAVVIGYGTAMLPRRRVLVAGLALITGTALSISWQARDEALYSSWGAIDRGNRQMLAEANRIVPLKCAAIGSSGYVRGYLNLVTGRSIVELATAESTAARITDGACGAIFLDGGGAFQDLQIINSITVTGRSGLVRVIQRGSP